MLKNLFKISFRSILRHKTAAIVNIIGLSIAMASFIMIYLWVYNEVSFNRNFEKSDRIYRISRIRYNGNTMNVSSQLPYPLITAIKEEIPGVEAISRQFLYLASFEQGDKLIEEYYLSMVDTSFFEVFDYEFIAGDPKKPFWNEYSLVVSEEVAEKYFPGENALGKKLKMHADEEYTISAIIKDQPDNTSINFNMFIPIDPHFRNSDDYNDWSSFFLRAYVYLPENIDLKEISKKMEDVFHKYSEDDDTEHEFVLEALSNIYLFNLDGENERIEYVYIFSLIAILILIIACINYTNIAASIAARRTKEVGIKKVLGSDKKNLIFQFYTEVFIITVLALILGMVAVELLRPGFNEITRSEITIRYFSVHFLCMLGLLIITISLIAGTYPALLLSSQQPAECLKGRFTGGPGLARFSRILVIFQIASSVFLIICVGFIYLQLDYIRAKELGFQKDNIIFTHLNSDVTEKYQTFKAELLKNPDITHVCRTSQLPNNINYHWRGIEWEGKNDEVTSSFDFSAVDFDYIETFDMQMIDGRPFSREYSQDSTAYILNETAVKLCGLKDPVGKKFNTEADVGRIIGVVKDFHSLPLTSGKRPVFFKLLPQYFSRIIIRFKEGSAARSREYVEKMWTEMFPERPLLITSFNDHIDAHYNRERSAGILAAFFAAVVILISCIGLFGLANHMARRKSKEIGIRKVFGASSSSMVMMLLRQYSLWLLIASLIATPFAFLFVKDWLQNFAYHIDINPLVFILACLLTFIIVVLTVGIQSYRAANKNPAESLKYE